MFQFVGQYDIVVNCTGFRSRDLVGDKSVYPVRGHLVRVCILQPELTHPHLCLNHFHSVGLSHMY